MASSKRKAKTVKPRRRPRAARAAIDSRYKGLAQVSEPPRDKNWANLDAAFRTRLAATLDALAQRGTPFVLVEGFRTVPRQQWLYGSGRPNAVPYGRPGAIVTQRDGVRKLSNHQGTGVPGTGRGADCYPVNSSGKVFIPPSSDPLWGKYAAAAMEQGLSAGHHWQSFKDSPHVELPPPASKAQLRKLVKTVQLPKLRALPAARRAAKAGPEGTDLPALPPVLADQSAQALVAGSGLVMAEEGVSQQVKQDITLCTLFAQFKASSVASPSQDIMAWYDAYFAALQQLGWAMTSQDFREYKQSGTSIQVHKAILTALTAVLGPAAATLAVTKAVLDGLEEAGSDNGWLTLLDRQSVHSKLASFQVVTAVPQPNGMVSIALLAFQLKARKNVTQVLFFKLKKDKASLKYAGGRASIEETVLAAAREPLKERLQAAVRDFVASVPIPGN
jgi:hypothetical protein